MCGGLDITRLARGSTSIRRIRQTVIAFQQSSLQLRPLPVILVWRGDHWRRPRKGRGCLGTAEQGGRSSAWRGHDRTLPLGGHLGGRASQSPTVCSTTKNQRQRVGRGRRPSIRQSAGSKNVHDAGDARPPLCLCLSPLAPLFCVPLSAAYSHSNLTRYLASRLR